MWLVWSETNCMSKILTEFQNCPQNMWNILLTILYWLQVKMIFDVNIEKYKSTYIAHIAFTLGRADLENQLKCWTCWSFQKYVRSISFYFLYDSHIIIESVDFLMLRRSEYTIQKGSINNIQHLPFMMSPKLYTVILFIDGETA